MQTQSAHKQDLNHTLSLNEYYKNKVIPFYQNYGTTLTELGPHGKSLSLRAFDHPNPKGLFILSTGFNESYYKYAETIFDIFHQGYSVYTHDHRGQGFSERLISGTQKPYIENFQDLVDDYTRIYYKFVTAKHKDKGVYCLAHSMGGAVLATALAQKTISPKAAILCAPMIGISIGPNNTLNIPGQILVNTLCLIGLKKSYAITQGDHNTNLLFEKNDVTNCKERFDLWQETLRQNPQLQLGGPTYNWLKEAFNACKNLRKISHQISTPVLLLQADDDTIVDNRSQDEFLNRLTVFHKKISFKNSKHEIFMEVDMIRQKAFHEIFGFINDVNES